MQVSYITQPDLQLGTLIPNLLENDPMPQNTIFVSAFVSLQTIMRLKDPVLALRNNGANFRFVLGIDLGGTSKEVLEELLSWDVETFIVKHRIPGHTFHPKIYYFVWNNSAEIIVGSNNLTDGGFFGNYEGCARICYDLPDDLEEFQQAQNELDRFLTPAGPTVYNLDNNFLNELINRELIPSEAQARRRNSDKISNRGIGGGGPLFGIEDIDSPPPLPAALLRRLTINHRQRRRAAPPPNNLPLDSDKANTIDPASFYMTLPTLQGPSIPGEARIPLPAIALAKEFWGWQDEYLEDVKPSGRVYWNWRPIWKVWSVDNPADISIQEVRMYMYTNSSDFRFYARPLVNAGGDLGDVVKITRISQPDIDYECVLARQGTPEYNIWINYCTQTVVNSPRLFGYA